MLNFYGRFKMHIVLEYKYKDIKKDRFKLHNKRTLPLQKEKKIQLYC